MGIYLRIPKSVGWCLLLLFLLFALTVATFSAARFLSLAHLSSEVSNAAPATPTGKTSGSAAHLIGGFGISTMSAAQSAAAIGIQTVFTYGPAYPEHSAIGRVFGTSLHMTQVEAQPWKLLYQYECHKLVSLHKPLNNYCSQDYPDVTPSALLAGVKADILTERTNPQLVGIWILDDWPSSDQGGAATVLPLITRMIHAYAPQIPTICGFGAELGAKHTDIFDRNVFANYTAAACNEVALYIYSASTPQSTFPATSYDWSMRTLLPRMLSALRARGWHPQTSSLIGIPQAFGGQ